MSSLSNGNGAAKPAASSKFQLPALDFKSGSLTDGTNIPPPLPSPKQRETSSLSKTTQAVSPVQSIKPAADSDVTTPTTTTTTSNGTQTTPEAHKNGLKQPVDQSAPDSPTSTKASPSIRRLLSRNRLNDAYNADRRTNSDEGVFVPRPVSQSNASIATDKQSKRSSGWFRRLRGSDGQESRRSSRIFISSEPARSSLPPAPKTTGPPAPVIPEFKAIGSKVDLSHDAGSLGSDLFKDIK
ncbi:hypothetical protein BD289DRAFT_483036 [Coniella lustricola]|uniref:Uncharacterized protein n=1 Tax=Coniella lustricola TaxID=2025994 RepID=A0A2T3A6Y9_9PEZI|nr:hypothetical protein BD289DRAFT_483036 [Coniella lustricola]